MRDLYEKIKRDKQEGRYVFGGLERCDYTKGLLERFEIFRRTLNRLRNSRKFKDADRREAKFYQVTSPSRLSNPAYQYLYELLRQEVIDKTNELKINYEPIIHIEEGIYPPENYRFMKEINVMLVTPLDDGMNLVAFEYILSQKPLKPEDRGILVLGASGASRLLKSKGFGEEDGVIHISMEKLDDAGARTANAFVAEYHISERLIDFVEKECRVDSWAQKNIDVILNCRKEV